MCAYHAMPSVPPCHLPAYHPPTTAAFWVLWERRGDETWRRKEGVGVPLLVSLICCVPLCCFSMPACLPAYHPIHGMPPSHYSACSRLLPTSPVLHHLYYQVVLCILYVPTTPTTHLCQSLWGGGRRRKEVGRRKTPSSWHGLGAFTLALPTPYHVLCKMMSWLL